MSAETIRAGITAFFQTAWTAGPNLPCQFSNQAFQRPDKAPWARFSILPADRFDAAIGIKHVRDIGIAHLQVFIPTGGGTKPFTDAFDAFCGIFDNISIGLTDGTDVQFYRAKSNYPPGDKDFWMGVGSVQYYADKITAPAGAMPGLLTEDGNALTTEAGNYIVPDP